MNAEIVTSGTELLLGDIVDTNSTYIARELRGIGVNVYFRTSVGDNVSRMARVLRDGLERSDLIITTGGLGPTVDDVTREAVAQVTGRELTLYPDCLASIETMFARWGRPMGENNRRQAFLPAGSIPIPNPVGTAPGFVVESSSGIIISLPGVPREMEHLMQSAVLPYLRQKLGDSLVVIKSKTLRTVGLGESWIDEQIDSLMRSSNPTVGLAAHLGAVDIRITARADSVELADAMIAEMEASVRARLDEDAVFGTGDQTLEEVTGEWLAKAGVRVALVESATRGQVAQRLRSTAMGSEAISAALVVDGPEALTSQLGLSREMLGCYGWVSEIAATEAATALSDTYEGGWGLAVLGEMAAPDDMYGNRTGETYVALVTPSATLVRYYPYGGQGHLSQTWVSQRVVDLVRRTAITWWRGRV